MPHSIGDLATLPDASPIVRELLAHDHEVVLAASGPSLQLLQLEFPALKSYELPAYAPTYPADGNMVWAMAKQLPHFVRTIRQENNCTKRIVESEKIDIVISDNRYGCYAHSAKNIFITHQITVLMPNGWEWMQPIVNYFNHRQIRKFQTCWVPAPNSDFFPELLHRPATIKPSFVGFLSRLAVAPAAPKINVLALLSGPSPQREQLGAILKKQFIELDISACLVFGNMAQQQQITTTGNLTEMNFATAPQLNQLMSESEIIVARSGYSTIMDLMGSKKKAIFVPTPGQTEQEYLAKTLQQKKIAVTFAQHTLDLRKAILETQQTTGFLATENSSPHLLTAAIQQL